MIHKHYIVICCAFCLLVLFLKRYKMEILQNGFCMIPNVVLYDNDLSDKQKLLYWTISSLCAEKWYCWASNDYIWELLNADKRTISRNIAVLSEKWYINITLDNNYKRYIELNSVVENRDSQKSQGGIDKNVYGGSQKCLNINIKDKDNNIIINNNTELWDNSEFSDLKDLSLSLWSSILKEKEKNSAKKEKEITVAINWFISEIKSICNDYWVAYDNTRDRQFAKHILTAKEYGDFCDKIGQWRIEFASNVLIASIKINYWKWPLAWPMKIYQNYADLYNQAKSKIQKTITPTINVL